MAERGLSSQKLAIIDGLAGTDSAAAAAYPPTYREDEDMHRLSENHNGGGSCGSEVSHHAGGQLLPGTIGPRRMGASAVFGVSMTEPWMRALGLPLEESVQCLPLDQALGRNPTDDYTILKGAMSRREDIEIPSLTLTSLAGVPNLSYAINAQPLRDTEGGVKCYLLEVTPHPEVHHLALLTEIEESTVKGKGKQKLCPTSPGDPSALPLVAAASQGSPLPRNFLVRKVLEEAAANQGRQGVGGGGGGVLDADMQDLTDLEPFSDALGVNLGLGVSGQVGVQRTASGNGVRRRQTVDSIDGGRVTMGRTRPSRLRSTRRMTDLRKTATAAAGRVAAWGAAAGWRRERGETGARAT